MPDEVLPILLRKFPATLRQTNQKKKDTKKKNAGKIGRSGTVTVAGTDGAVYCAIVLILKATVESLLSKNSGFDRSNDAILDNSIVTFFVQTFVVKSKLFQKFNRL